MQVGVARDLTREKEKQRVDFEMKRLKAFNDGIQIIDFTGHMEFVKKRLS